MTRLALQYIPLIELKTFGFVWWSETANLPNPVAVYLQPSRRDAAGTLLADLQALP